MERPLCDRCDAPAEYHHYQTGLAYCAACALAHGVRTEPGTLLTWSDHNQEFR